MRTGGSRAVPARSRSPRPPLEWPGAASQEYRWRHGPGWLRSHGLLASAGAVSLRRPALPPASASVASVRSPEGVAGGSRPGGGRGGRELGRRCGCPCRVRWCCLVWGRPAWCFHVRREQRALAARRYGAGTASLTCVGGEGNLPPVSRLHKRVACVRRGRSHACALGCLIEGGTPGPVGTGQVGHRGHSGAEPGRAGDRQQPPLVPRSGSWRRLTPSVRCRTVDNF
jgi:hypothetical protein